MTVGCPGNGPSRRKAGFEPTQILLNAAIAEALVSLGMPEFAVLFAGVAVLEFALDTVCQVGPPALPVVDAARIKLYYDTQSTQAYPLILQDAQDFVGHYLWYQWCECVTGPQPTPPAATPLPPGLSLDTPPVSTTLSASCAGGSQIFETHGLDANGDSLFIPLGTHTFVTGCQWVQWTHNGGFATGDNSLYPATLNFNQYDAAGALVDRFTWTQTTDISAATPVLYQMPRSLNAQTYDVSVHSSPGAGHSFGLTIKISQICTAAPIGLGQPCCPPDERLENLIVQVLRLEQLILQSLGGSTNYTLGTAHPGTVGTGSLPIASLRGISAHVTAGTPTTPLLPGNPPYEWNLGWMSVMTGDGMIEEKRLTRQSQVWLPESMPLATTFGFFLFPGVVATFTELVPA